MPRSDLNLLLKLRTVFAQANRIELLPTVLETVILPLNQACICFHRENRTLDLGVGQTLPVLYR